MYRSLTERIRFKKVIADTTYSLMHSRQAIEQQKNYLKKIINSSMNGIVTASDSGMIESFNSAAERIFGWSESEMVGKKLNTLMSDPDASECSGYLPYFRQMGEGKIIGFQRQVKGKHKTGCTMDLKFAGLSCEIENRTVYIAFVGDMSEIEILRFERATFFDLSLELICLVSNDGYFKQVNHTWCKVLGYSMEELLTTPYIELLHPDDIAPSMAEMAKLRDPTYQTVNFENRYRDKSGEYHWLQWNAVLNNTHDIVYACARDITTEKDQQEFLQRTNEKMLLANTKLQQLDGLKSMFIATMSHELRTPLNSIIGFSSVMLQGLSGELSAVQRDHLTRVHKASKHLLAMISDIIDVSKIEAERFDSVDESFDLHEVAQEVITLAESLSAQYKIQVTTDITPGLILSTDVRRVKQVLLNLVSNAIKYSLKGQVTLTAATEGSNIIIAVIDQGVGISAQDLEFLFQPFSRLDTLRIERAGTGLGLYLTKKIVDGILLGSITVTSAVDVGSRFVVTIPRKRDWQLHSGEHNVTTYGADHRG